MSTIFSRLTLRLKPIASVSPVSRRSIGSRPQSSSSNVVPKSNRATNRHFQRDWAVALQSHHYCRHLGTTAVADRVQESKATARGVKTCDSERMIEVQWGDGSVSKYPYVWLRDNCRCTACYHHEAQGRIALIEDLDPDVEPSHATVSGDGSQVNVHWKDGHQSPFNIDLLQDVTFQDEVQRKNIRLWGSELKIPTFDFNEIMQDDKKLLHYLEELRDVGLVIAKNAPAETGNVAKFANRISFMKLTSYGITHTVKSKVDPVSLAYTGLKLGLHTDLPHYHYTPNITMFHCIKQSGGTEGGESIFTDGFKTALQLKEEDPKAFEILCNTYCDYIEKGTDMIEYYTKSSWPTFSFDRLGNLYKVHYSNALRDTRLRMPVEKVYPYYKAIKTYDNLIHRAENTVVYRMQAGDMILFDNTRALHGRRAFKVTKDSIRHLETAYIDWDNMHSKIRVLREKLGMPFHHY